jgi:hypothetical protein
MYYKDEKNELQHKSFVFLSSNLDHGSQFVRAAQMKLVPYLKTLIKVKKIIYWSDGAASQFKNKWNFFFLSLHKKNFGMLAEYNFFATAHGKGAVDGVGATVKRILRLQSFKANSNISINDADEAYSFLLENARTLIKPFMLSPGAIKKINLPQSAVTVPGTRSFHNVTIQSENPTTLLFKIVATDLEGKLFTYQ